MGSGKVMALMMVLWLLGGAWASATVLSVTNHQAVGASLDLNPSATYTHKLDFPADGQSAPINGVQFSAVGAVSGTDPLTGNPYRLTMNAPSNWGGGSTDILWDFIHNSSQPVGSAETLVLGGLTPGNRYETRVYYRNFGPRPNTVTVNTGRSLWSGTLDEATASDRNYWSIVFDAEATSVSIQFLQQQSNNSWHQYAVSNQFVSSGTLHPRTLISDLYNTGVFSDDSSGLNATLLANGVADPHYRFVSGPQAPPGGILPQAEVQLNNSAWALNGPNSKWIGVTASGNDGVAGGTYRYETTFSIPSDVDPGTVSVQGLWFVDNQDANTRLYLNGVDTLSGGGGTYYGGSLFTLIDNANNSGAHFQPGLNSLIFQVENLTTTPNPHGLRVEQLLGSGESVPESATLSLLALGGLALLRRRRSARRAG